MFMVPVKLNRPVPTLHRAGHWRDHNPPERVMAPRAEWGISLGFSARAPLDAQKTPAKGLLTSQVA